MNRTARYTRIALLCLLVPFWTLWWHTTALPAEGGTLVPTIHYSDLYYERHVIPNRKNPRRAGDYKPNLVVRPLCGEETDKRITSVSVWVAGIGEHDGKCVDGYTAVRWANQGMIDKNMAVVIADPYVPGRELFLQVMDHQRIGDATTYQRLEVDGRMAHYLNIYSGWSRVFKKWFRGRGRCNLNVLRYVKL